MHPRSIAPSGRDASSSSRDNASPAAACSWPEPRARSASTTAPISTGSTPPARRDTPYRVAINEKIGFVASEEGGLSVLDVSVPDRDQGHVGDARYVRLGCRRRRDRTPMSPTGGSGCGWWMFMIRPPRSIVGTCILANIASVTIAGNYAYVTEPVLQTFYVIDVSDPTLPVIVAGPLHAELPVGHVGPGRFRLRGLLLRRDCRGRHPGSEEPRHRSRSPIRRE